MKFRFLFSVFILLSVCALKLQAVIFDFTWIGGGTAGDVNDSANWVDGLKPGGSSGLENVTFSDVESAQTILIPGSGFSLHDLIFDNSGTDYTFHSTSPTPTLLLNGDVTALFCSGDVLLDTSIQLALSNATHTVNVADGVTITVDSQIVDPLGPASIVKEGSGTLVLTGDNTFRGGLTLQAGELVLGSSTDAGLTHGPVGTGTLTLWGGSYLTPGASTVTLANTIFLQQNEDSYVHIDDDEGHNNLTLTGSIAGDAGIDWCTLGTLTLTNSGNTFSGGVDMRAGTLLIGASSSAHHDEELGLIIDNGPVGTGELTFYSETTLGVAPESGNHTLHNTIFLATESQVTFDASNGDLTLKGHIYGSGGINKTGSGTLTLSNSNTFGGGVTVSAGTLLLDESSYVDCETITGPVGSGSLTLEGGTTLAIANCGEITLDNNIFLSGGSGSVTFDSRGGSLTLNGYISGNLSATKTGSGTVTLTGANEYTGSTTINDGVLAVSTLANGGTASGIGSSSDAAGNLILDGGTLSFISTSGSTAYTNRHFTIGVNGGGIDSSGTQAITFNGSGSIALAGSNTARTLKLSGTNASIHNAIEGNLGDNGTGKTSLFKDGAGTWSLRGTNTYTGSTTVNGGKLVLDNDNALPSSTDVTIASGASLEVSYHNISMGSLAGSGTLMMIGGESGPTGVTIGGSNLSSTFSGVISGNSQNTLTKTGTGTLTLSGVNTYGGGTTILGGQIVAGNSSALGSGSVTLNGGSLGVASGVTLMNTLSFSGGVTKLGGNGTFGTPITVNGNVALSPGNSPGTLTFSAGLTLAAGGTLDFQVQDASGAGGTGYDLLTVSGILSGPGTSIDITATSGAQFTINLQSLNGSGNPGNAAVFNPATSYSWTFATAANGISGFASNKFLLNSGAFSNTLGGSFSITNVGNNLLLNFTPAAVPEPSTWVLMIMGVASLPLILRRRRT